MSKKKYVMSGGLAFSENQDMEKLRKLSQKGWHVKKFSFLGYTLEQGKQEDYIYSIDYRTLTSDEEEYFELFNSAGWSHIDSQANIHLFKATPDTKPLYTDRETTVEKYRSSAKPLQLATVFLIPATIIAWFLHGQMTGSLQTFLFILATILTVFAIPTAWTALTATGNKWQAENKNARFTVSKLIPPGILVIAVFALFVSEAKPLNIIGAAIIGAVVGVAFINACMTLLHKTKKA